MGSRHPRRQPDRDNSGIARSGDASTRLYRRGRVWYTWFYVDGKQVRASTGRCDEQAAAIRALEMEREATGATDAEIEALAKASRSFVYFVEGAGGAFKIGTAASPTGRVCDIQIGSPVKLRLVTAMPGSHRLERAIHAALADYRMEGEWFRAALPVLALVREIRAIYGSPNEGST